MVMHGSYDKKRRKGRLEFEWFLRAGKLWRHKHERIEDNWWTDAEIRRALKQAGFDRIRRWDGVDVRPPSPHSKRGFDLYYLARKRQT